MLGEGIVDNADKGLEVVCEGERDGYVREGMDEIGGAVDRIADECRSRGKKGRSRCGR